MQPAEDRSERAGAALAAIEDAWLARDEAAFLAAAGESAPARAWAVQTYDALSLLGVHEIGLRWVEENPAATTVRSAREFEADVAVTWSPGTRPDADYRTASTLVPLSLFDTGDAVEVRGLAREPVAARPVRDALPLWLSGELVASGRPQARCLGIGTDPRDISCARLARVALRELDVVLPGGLQRAGRLLIVLPDTVDHAAALLGRPSATLEQIAGVTATVDASGAPGAPQLVVLNPDSFLPLGPSDRQLVVTHESVHVATGAAVVVLPVWVAEGFADYVALLPGRIPLGAAAAEALDRVRRVGAPRTLPRDDDFGSGRLRLGEAYQQAWLAFRLLGERYGREAVVGFYTAVLDGARVGPALREAAGIDRAAFIRAWRAELVRLAS